MAESPNDFHAVVGDLLERRAASTSVVPDLDALLTPVPAAPTATELVRSGCRRWLVAAAALLVLAPSGAAVVQRSSDDGSAVDVPHQPPRRRAPRNGLAAPSRLRQPGDVIIWLEPTATEADVAAVGTWLDDQDLEVPWTYIDTDQTWAEFQRFWADSPEVLGAVTPAQLPTSFRLTTPDPLAFVNGLDRANLTSVKAFESADVTGSCAERPACIEVQIDQEIADLESQGRTPMAHSPSSPIARSPNTRRNCSGSDYEPASTWCLPARSMTAPSSPALPMT